MKTKLESIIKAHWKLFLLPGIIAITITLLLTDYSMSEGYGIVVSIVTAIIFGDLFYFVLLFIFSACLVLKYFFKKLIISVSSKRNNDKTKRPLEDLKPLPSTYAHCNQEIVKEQIEAVHIPAYKVSTDDDVCQDDLCQKCLIGKAPFIQPNAKRLKSIKTYIVLDTETTGLSCKRDKIIEISLARYTNGERTDRYTTLINPLCHIPKEVTAINHIRDEDVVNAPTFANAWPQISCFFDGSVIVGHNVTFDLNMIGYNMPRKAQSLEVSYLDTVRLAKDAFPGQSNYKLATLIETLGISDSQEHRADSDVDLTAKLFELCRATIIDKYERDLKERREQKVKEKAARQANYGWSPLLDKNFVFTGEFQRDREKLQNALQTVGANLRTEINTKTSYLVCGNLENLPPWALERKFEKAKKMIENGTQIIVISEDEYLTLLKSTIEQKPRK